MGCWNETCGLTRLPIHYKDQVALFLIEADLQNLSSEGTHHPCALPIYGTYNDYGNIDLDNDRVEYHESVYSTIKKMYPRQTSERDLSTFLHDVERGTFAELNFILFRKSALESLIATMGEDNRTSFAEQSVREFVESAVDAAFEEQDMWSLMPDISRLCFSSTLYGTHILSLAREAQEKSPDIREGIVQWQMTVRLMSKTRTAWTVPAGRGSQESDHDFMRTLAMVTIKEAEQIDKSFE